ncbi:hypothetical protein [Maribellus maritimus]|uniref:hypothetical protein n=1 Tax=Maribellus maritimus TaxID=2870838 RepID=UPI001EEAFC2A|nr:hypothetical protein [Maribellus maritimus]MCG6191188.1 hypothetical protein [Maribellus maritimus]
MMKRICLFAVVAGIMLTGASCSKDETNGPDESKLTIEKENYTFLKSGSLYNEAEKDRSENYSSPFEIENVERTGDIMNITVSFPAGCEINKFEVIWDGMIMESYPVQTRIFIKRNASGCPGSDEMETEVLSVDLEELIFEGNDAQLQDAIIIVSNASKKPDTQNADVPVSNDN